MNKSNVDDAALRRLFALGIDGDSRIYKQFLGELSVLLRAYVRRQLVRLGRSHDDVEDIVQEALMAIHSRRHTYQSDLPVTAWAYAITRYKLIDHVRKTRHHSQDVELDESTIEIDDSESIDASLAVQRMVSKLPHSLQRPLEMIKLEGYSTRDVAIVTGSSEVAVRVSLHRALKALSGLLSGDRRARNENR